MARYRVELYRDARGYSQVLEFFDFLRRRNPKLWAFALRLLKTLEQQGSDLRPPLAKPLKGSERPSGNCVTLRGFGFTTGGKGPRSSSSPRERLRNGTKPTPTCWSSR